MSEKKPLSLDDIDNFWDLNSLLPQKRPVSRDALSISTQSRSMWTPTRLATPERLYRSARRVSLPPYSAAAVIVAAAVTIECTAAAAVNVTITVSADRDRQHTKHTDLAARRKPPHTRAALKMRAQQNEPKILEPYLVYEPDSSIIKRVSVSKWQTRYNFYEKFASDAARLWNRTSGECDNVPFFSYIPQYNQLSYTQLKWYLCWREKVRNGVYPRCDYSYILLFIYEILNCPD